MKIAWATDIHLNWKIGNKDFYDKVLFSGVDAVFLTGDIAEASDVSSHLMEMVDKFKVPIYYVLGNHDYYGGSIETVRREQENITDAHDNLFYLPIAGVCELTKDVCAVGVDGWYDGRCGNVLPPRVIMNDWNLIEELKAFSRNYPLLVEELRSLVDAEIALAEMYLREAAQKYSTVYFLTHVPPWYEAVWHLGHCSDADWRPWFTSVAMGDLLESLAAEYPLTNFRVLCGHSHSPGEVDVAPNLTCRTGKAEYGKPGIAELFKFRR